MRIVFIAQVVAVALLVSGCPGAPASDPTGGGTCIPGMNCETGAGGTGGTGQGGAGGAVNGGSGGAGMGGAGNGGGAGGSTNTGSGGSGGADCAPLMLEIQQTELPAQKCNLEGTPGMQCKEIIQGLCCPIAVNDLNSPEVQAYLDALKQYQQMGCMAMCPPDPCPAATNAKCTPDSMGNGTCGAP